MDLLNELKSTYDKLRVLRVDRTSSGPFKTMIIIRLNPWIFRIFELSEWKLKLNSSDCGVFKIFRNETKPEAISWETNMKNLFFNVWRRWEFSDKLHRYQKHPRKFKTQKKKIPRESVQNNGTPRISMIHWIISSFLKWKKLRTEKPINDTRGTCFVNVFKAGDISAKFKYGKTELLQFLKK